MDVASVDESGDDDEATVLNDATTRDRAEATAEVSAMGTTHNDRARHRVAEEQAVMGGAGMDEDAVQGFEVTDPSGRLVQQRFFEFLGTWYVYRGTATHECFLVSPAT